MQLGHSVKMMGTIIDIVVDSDTPHQHIKEVCHLITVYKNRFNANDNDPELMIINHNAVSLLSLFIQICLAL